MNIIKSTTQATAQAIAREVREQSNEILKSATAQVATKNETSQPARLTSASADVGVDPAEIKKKEQALLKEWRARVSEIASEENRARQERAQTSQAWIKTQEELMKEPEDEEQVFVEAQGKAKRVPEGGHQIKQQQQKHELGRGAKN